MSMLLLPGHLEQRDRYGKDASRQTPRTSEERSASCTPLRPSDVEGRAEPLERLLRVPGGPALQGHDAAVAEAVQCGGDGRVVDLAAPGLATAGYVGDLDLADQRQRPLDQGNQVPLADLGVVEVQVEP